jgi:hypothetical protein
MLMKHVRKIQGHWGIRRTQQEGLQQEGYAAIIKNHNNNSQQEDQKKKDAEYHEMEDSNESTNRGWYMCPCECLLQNPKQINFKLPPNCNHKALNDGEACLRRKFKIEKRPS